MSSKRPATDKPAAPKSSDHRLPPTPDPNDPQEPDMEVKRLQSQIAELEQQRNLGMRLYDALNQIGALIQSTLEFDDIMRKAVTEAAVALGCDTAAVSLRDSQGWIVRYAYGFGEDVVGRHMSDEEELHAVHAMNSKRPVLIEDALNDRRVNRKHLKKWNIRSVIVIPLVRRGEVMGVVFFNYQRNPVVFTAAHFDFAEKLGSAVTLALSNAALLRQAQAEVAERMTKERELQKLNRTLKALSKSSQAMMRATTESTYLAEVCRIVQEDCGHTMVWLGFAEEDEAKTVRPVASAGFEEGYLENLGITWDDTQRGRGPTGTAIRTGAPSVCRNIETDERLLPWREDARKRGYAASIALPLTSDGKTIGALTIYSATPDSFSDEEIALLGEIANDVAFGITTLRLNAAHAAMEAALLDSEERFRSLVENAKTPIAILDPYHNFAFINDLGVQLLCTKGNDIIGKRCTTVVAESQHDLFEKALRKFEDSGSDEPLLHIAQLFCKPAPKTWIEWEISAIRTLGQVKGFIVNLRGIDLLGTGSHAG